MKIAILKEFVKNPRTVGTILPSSNHLALEITSKIELEKAKTIVEIGPGSGVFTAQIIKKIPKDAKFLAIELNKDFHSRLLRKYPNLNIINDTAEHLVEIIEQHGIKKIDAIVSGLPWASFPETLQRKIIGEIYTSLSNSGYFATYAYVQGRFLPAGRRLKKILHEKFALVQQSRIILKNFPPAYVYRCKKNPN